MLASEKKATEEEAEKYNRKISQLEVQHQYICTQTNLYRPKSQQQLAVPKPNFYDN